MSWLRAGDDLGGGVNAVGHAAKDAPKDGTLWPSGVPAPPPASPCPLTSRELQVLNAICDGLTNAQIGQRLGASSLTVKCHLSRMARKLGTGDRAGMVGIGFRAGWLR